MTPSLSITNEVGIVGGEKSLTAFCSLSHTTGNFTPVDFANSTICSFVTESGSSTLTASTFSLPPNCSTSAWYLGKLFLQGPQKVAQKSRITTVPLASFRVAGPSPLTESAEKSGAGLPTRPPAAPLSPPVGVLLSGAGPQPAAVTARADEARRTAR